MRSLTKATVTPCSCTGEGEGPAWLSALLRALRGILPADMESAGWNAQALSAVRGQGSAAELIYLVNCAVCQCLGSPKARVGVLLTATSECNQRRS